MKKVRCIDTAKSPRLILGKIYQVESETTWSYQIKDEWFDNPPQSHINFKGLLGGWNKDRFVIVSEDEASATVSSTATFNGRQEKPCQTCGKNNDVGVNVCWCCGNQPHT
jgi:hypothetical protein